jgi:hypothetical protein
LGAAVKIPAGAHKITAGLTNDFRTSSCDRNVMIDKLSLTTAVAPAPAPTPTPAPAPEPAPAPASAPSISNLTASVKDGVATISYAKSGGAISSLTWRTTGTAAHTGSIAQPDVATFTAALPAGSYTMYVRAANALGADEDPVTITIPATTPTPDPEPTPEPAAPSGRLIWNGDFATGNLTQYTSTGGKVQYDTSVDEMRVVDDPVLGGPAVGGRKALKVTVHNSSKDPAQDSPKHRAQAESPKVIGLTDEVYVGYSLLLPHDFPTVHTAGPVTWGGINVQQASLWEVHGYPYGGSPPMGFRVRDSLASSASASSRATRSTRCARRSCSPR